MGNFSQMKLGKKAAFSHSLTPKMASLILPGTMAPPPVAVDYTTNVKNWPMFLNDKLGDCTIAAIGHLIQLYTSYTKPSAYIMTDDSIIKTYSAVSGYVPGNEATDGGAVEANVLQYWMNTGVSVNNYMDKIAGYARINTSKRQELQYAIYWFGGAYIGVNLPLAWQSSGTTWAIPEWDSNAQPGSWGGHAVPLVGYDQDWLTVISWGEKIRMSWEAYELYCDESWAVISPDFVNQLGYTPAHFDWSYLLAGMAHIREDSV